MTCAVAVALFVARARASVTTVYLGAVAVAAPQVAGVVQPMKTKSERPSATSTRMSLSIRSFASIDASSSSDTSRVSAEPAQYDTTWDRSVRSVAFRNRSRPF